MAEAVRESTLLEYIEKLDIPQNIKERMIKRYWDEVEERRRDIQNVREERRAAEEKILKELQDKNILISVLIAHIRDRELL